MLLTDTQLLDLVVACLVQSWQTALFSVVVGLLNMLFHLSIHMMNGMLEFSTVIPTGV